MLDALRLEADRVPREKAVRTASAGSGSSAPELTVRGAEGDGHPVVFEREEHADPHEESARVLALADELGVEAWRTPSDELYVSVRMGCRLEHIPIASRKLKNTLKRAYFERYDAAVKSDPLNDALGVLEGRALAGPEHEVFTRMAEHAGAVYVDLADDEGHVVVITRRGWTVESDVPVRFRRPSGMLALPIPMRGGSVEELRPILNVEDGDAWVLLVGHLIGSLHPSGPFLVLVLIGEKGTAKSTATVIVVRLLDPKDAPLRRPPRDERDLAIAARNGRVLAFNNLSFLSQGLSDALSSLATEGGFTTRKLYSDDEEARFRDRRPIVLNGIPDFVTRGDLADRSIKIELPRIERNKRRLEKRVLGELDAVRPRVLGALYDAVAHALATQDEVILTSMPRMADAVQWITAAEPALGWAPGTFLAAFERALNQANQNVVEADPVALALLEFASETPWRGAAGELLGDLSERCPEAAKKKTWPDTPQAMRAALVRCAPELRAVGVHVVQDDKEDSKARTRLWTVVRRPAETKSPRGDLGFEPRGDEPGGAS